MPIVPQSNRTSPSKIASRTALIRQRFPRLAELADQDAARRARLNTTGRGPAEGVIHVAATTDLFWHDSPAARVIAGDLEDYVRRAVKRNPRLRGADVTAGAPLAAGVGAARLSNS